MNNQSVVAYQVPDSLCFELPDEPVDLVISGVPLYILGSVDLCVTLFDWFDRYVAPDGLVIIDIPGQYNQYTLNLREVEKRSVWRFQWGEAFYDYYQPGDVQSYCAYKRKGTEGVGRPNEFPYQQCQDREMAHICEFDYMLIRFLIEQFSEIGDAVLDPFCGHGMAPRVAFELGRKGIGIDRRCPFTNREVF